ncbi:MAG TPA: hypothetical protein DCZ94_14025 [Lentisphaeria bacterium]|nr:MAG: hypothetical protein A2X48_03845 [Lentisphaerae bacterium GWF2_49_21]HBC88063.1 hypothetical protein [Lentisphaeria bacterium]
MIKIIPCLFFILILAGCHPSPQAGTYKQLEGTTTLTVKSNGTLEEKNDFIDKKGKWTLISNNVIKGTYEAMMDTNKDGIFSLSVFDRYYYLDLNTNQYLSDISLENLRKRISNKESQSPTIGVQGIQPPQPDAGKAPTDPLN